MDSALSNRQHELGQAYLRTLLDSFEGKGAESYQLMAHKSVPRLRTGCGLVSQSSRSGSRQGKNQPRLALFQWALEGGKS